MKNSRFLEMTSLVVGASCLLLLSCMHKLEYEAEHESTVELQIRKPMLNIFVYTPGFSDNCGGCTVLHYLVDRINVWFEDQPVKAYLVPFDPQEDFGTNKAYKTPIIPEWKSVKDGYVIYPEIVFGNPLGVDSSKIVRWILYFPGVNGGPPASAYSQEEKIVCYSMGFCDGFNSSYDVSLLKLSDYGLELLEGLHNSGTRNGTLVHHKKRKWGRQVQSPPEIAGTLLQNTLSKFDRLELFSKYERFISTDPATFLSVEAAMAGCLSVVVPFEGVSREEWLRTSYAAADLKYGIAYGESNVPHARKTLPYVVENLKSQHEKQKRHLEHFLSRLAIEHVNGH